MTIGELAGRLRISPRALRHYESVGLLRPAHVDERSGYRYYGEAELARGLQIAELKAAGLPLAAIAGIVDARVPLRAALEAQRARLQGAIDVQRHQLALVEALLSGGTEITRAELVEVPAVDAVVAEAVVSEPGQLAGTIRRLVQRLRRQGRRHDGTTPAVFSATFPIDATRPMATRVAAHLDAPGTGSVRIAGSAAMAVDVVGTHALLAAAQSTAVAAAGARGLTPRGWVWEQYLDIGPVPRTRLLIPVTASGAAG